VPALFACGDGVREVGSRGEEIRELEESSRMGGKFIEVGFMLRMLARAEAEVIEG